MIQKKGTKQTTYLSGNVPSIRYHIFENLSFIQDGFSTRLGGVSSGQYESLNFSVKMGDSLENVQKNFEIFMREHQFLNPVMTDQTHTTNVLRVYAGDAGKNIFRPRDYHDIDGFVTNDPHLTLVTSFADCVPLYFVDSENRAIGLAHSGWRGTIGKIGQVVVQKMRDEFGSKPEQLLTAIGPSICVDCYEVSEDLAVTFQKTFSNDVAYCNLDTGKFHLNLWEANRQVLLESGILEEHIAMPDICTCCNNKILFSHRASKGKRGNMCAFLMIK